MRDDIHGLQILDRSIMSPLRAIGQNLRTPERTLARFAAARQTRQEGAEVSPLNALATSGVLLLSLAELPTAPPPVA